MLKPTPKSGPKSASKSGPVSQQHDHTGWRHIWQLAWPIMLSNVTIPLVGAVDVAMMGRLDDPVFIGGVGLGMIVFNFIYFGLGFLRMGTTGLVAQMYGTGQDDKIAFFLIRGITLAFGLGGVFILASPLVSTIAVNAFSASELAEQLMVEYISIRIFAVPAALANMVLLGGLYGRQQMRLGMGLLFLVNGINLVLDVILVTGFGMSVNGVALASVAAQWGGLAFMIWRITRRWPGQLGRLLRPPTGARLPEWLDLAAYRQFFSLGRDIFIRTILLIGCEALLLNEAAKLDDLALATCQIMLSLFGLLAFAIDGFAHAAEALVGEAIGRRNPLMLRIVIRRTNYLAGMMALMLACLLWAGQGVILALLTSQEELIIFIDDYWKWVIILPLVSFLAFQMDGIFVGATKGTQMRNAMIIASAGFAIAIFYLAVGLAGLMASFASYLALRGISLWCLIGHVHAEAEPLKNDT
ncbi:MAG: MATE family efflux transporter [Candidatus Puniceispirillaceae bacterium]